MPPALRVKRQAVAHAAARLTEILLARSLKLRSGKLRSGYLDSKEVRSRMGALVKASLSYNDGLTAWQVAEALARKASHTSK